MANSWQAIAARKQQERTSRIPREWLLKEPPFTYAPNAINIPRRCGLLTEHELSITENHDATSLLVELSKGTLTSEQVVTAFSKRAAIAQQVCNCLTEIFFEDAIARAKELDAYLKKNGRPIGPLHGLPISLKDGFKVRSYDASVGVAGLCFEPAATNSALVDLLLSLGAVLYCKTNIPLTMMALDSHNNVFGRTLNPAHHELTAGGSSGGEGALVAMRGSILGVGTDVGGSIRIPAACNNLYGVKPSHGRIPFAGQEGGQKPGSTKLGIEATAGPIATTTRDCAMFMRVIANGGPELFDPEVVAQGWDQLALLNTKQKPLRVGIARGDGHVKPLPPIAKLMDDVAQTLRAAPGQAIEVMDVDVSPILSRCLKTFNGIMSIDGANAWFDHMEVTGEPLSPWLQGRLTRRPQKSLDEVRGLQAARTELQTTFLNVWKESGGYWLTDASEAHIGDRTLDALICPVAPHPIPPIDRWNTANYTAAFNLLDLSTGVVPVRAFDSQDLQGDIPSDKPLNGWDKINRELWTKVDKNVYLGSPLSVQVVTPRLTERRLVEAMGVIDAALQPLRTSGRRESRL
ncbi:hypothetical protein M409DRAFT_69376 [Zasmidium cellare ATCC 36951]|uniref:amidase n=1 Tax=Zasmidium cellare ATCC 36951 TaxID=1080233 RepID=A0A6A6C944_ZASCE|nr:uncharacterized protein M409DRAFT_69376 [Zasmidium cellare ATCC 36951]KAF2162169.1 hypothetical protein M409DRAFT_69376 [Zasmidium cellare ATCC 36951]